MKIPAKIMIIDDNPDFLFTMETFLKRNGFETVTAKNGREGLDMIRKVRLDLILLDIMMEVLFSGFEVCRQVRSDPDLKHIPIIGISAMAHEVGVRFNMDKDMEYFAPDEFFEKPVDKENLLAKIAQLLKL